MACTFRHSSFCSLSVQTAEITGAGASFPAPIYAKWADALPEGDEQPRQPPVDPVPVAVSKRITAKTRHSAPPTCR